MHVIQRTKPALSYFSYRLNTGEKVWVKNMLDAARFRSREDAHDCCTDYLTGSTTKLVDVGRNGDEDVYRGTQYQIYRDPNGRWRVRITLSGTNGDRKYNVVSKSAESATGAVNLAEATIDEISTRTGAVVAKF